jgi:hypothetical protein
VNKSSYGVAPFTDIREVPGTYLDRHTIYAGIHLVCIPQSLHKNSWVHFNTLRPELNPICYLLALLAHDFLHVSRIRVKLRHIHFLLLLFNSLFRIIRYTFRITENLQVPHPRFAEINKCNYSSCVTHNTVYYKDDLFRSIFGLSPESRKETIQVIYKPWRRRSLSLH